MGGCLWLPANGHLPFKTPVSFRALLLVFMGVLQAGRGGGHRLAGIEAGCAIWFPQRGQGTQGLEGLQGEMEKGMLIDHGPPGVQRLALRGPGCSDLQGVAKFFPLSHPLSWSKMTSTKDSSVHSLSAVIGVLELRESRSEGDTVKRGLTFLGRNTMLL